MKRLDPRSRANASTGCAKQRQRKQPKAPQGSRRTKKARNANLTLTRSGTKLDFIHDLSAKSGLPLTSVHKLFRGLKVAAASQLRELGSCRIAGACDLTVKIMPPCDARIIHRFGKELRTKVRAEPVKKISARVLFPLRSVCA